MDVADTGLWYISTDKLFCSGQSFAFCTDTYYPPTLSMENSQLIYDAVNKVIKFSTDSDLVEDLTDGQEQLVKIINEQRKEGGGNTCEKAACLGAICKLFVKNLKKGCHKYFVQ